MSGEYELTWKREPETGNWLATDDRDGTLYIAGGNQSPAGWSLTAHVPGRPGQWRTGFSKLGLAKAAALNTRCHLCGRFGPFATLEQSGRLDGWRCRDRKACAAAEAEKTALAEQVSRKIRSTDMDDVAVTDREDGPVLVLTQHGTRQVTQCTENDLLRLAVALLDRWRGRPEFPGALADDIGRASLGLKDHYEDRAGTPWRMS